MIISQEININNSRFDTFESFVETVFEKQLEEGRRIVRNALSEADRQVMAVRDKRRYRDKGLRSTSIKTKLGVFEYKRHIRRDNQDG